MVKVNHHRVVVDGQIGDAADWNADHDITELTTEDYIISGDLSGGGSGTRALNGIYHNTTGRGMWVVTTITLLGPTVGDNAYAFAQVQSISPPINQIGHIDLQFGTGNVGGEIDIPFTFYVPAGYFYQIAVGSSGTGAVYLSTWNEMTIGVTNP